MKRVMPGPKRTPILAEERQNFTCERVRDILETSIKDKNTKIPKLSELLLSRLTSELQALRNMVIVRQSDGYKKSLEHRIKLADGLRVLKCCLPSLIQECARAQSHAKGDGKEEAIPIFEAGEEILRSLAVAAYTTERCWLFAAVTDEPAEVRWEQYADQIIRTLQELLPSLQREALYRFLAAVFRDITGEVLTVAGVKRALGRDNVVKWRNLPT